MEQWKKLKEELVYDDWRKVIKKSYQLPDGKTYIYDIIGNNDYVTVVAFTKDRKAILTKQFRPGPELILTSFPEGYIDEGETPQETALRELKEETGFVSDNIRLIQAFRRAYNNEKRYVLMALDCEKKFEPKGDDTEFIETELMSFEEFRAYLRQPSESGFTNTDAAYLAIDLLGWL